MSVNPDINGESSEKIDVEFREDFLENILSSFVAYKEKKTEEGGKTFQEFGQTAKSRNCFTSPKAKKRKSTTSKAKEFIEVCQQALEKSDTEITEYEAVRIHVRKKLEKMESTQAIYAENLINTILRKGLLNQLTSDSVVCDTRLLDILLRGNNTPSTSLTATEVSSSPNSVQPSIKSEPEH